MPPPPYGSALPTPTGTSNGGWSGSPNGGGHGGRGWTGNGGPVGGGRSDGARAPGAGFQLGGRNAIWLIAIVAVVVALLHFHRITEFTVIQFTALVISIVLHEVSHGVVAGWFGDDTAKRAGRITLNPIPHIDPIGTVVLPVLLTLSGAPAFGWAKPVPVNLSNLRHPRNQAVAVGLAGPAVNIILATIAGLAWGTLVPTDLKGLYLSGPASQPVWAQFLLAFGLVNVVLAVFNLIPIPPLDGSSVVERFIPRAWLPGYLRIRPYTLVLPLILVLLPGNVLDDLFNPALNLWAHLLGPGNRYS
jgi:Zn-dependent protease